MPNPTVQAVAEGMPRINMESLTIGPIVEELRLAMGEHREAYARLVALYDQFEKMTWSVPRNIHTHSLFGEAGQTFHDPKEAREYFDAKLADVEERVRTTLFAGSFETAVARDRAQIHQLREMALAVLEPRKAAEDAAGLTELDQKVGDLEERAFRAFSAALDAPCQTLADVRAKASLFLSASSAFGGELEYSESQRFLRSILTVEA